MYCITRTLSSKGSLIIRHGVKIYTILFLIVCYCTKQRITLEYDTAEMQLVNPPKVIAQLLQSCVVTTLQS
jgi:hypothetical protein